MSEAHGVVSRGPPPGASDALTLIAGGKSLTGWQRVSVTRPLAAIPARFSIEVTEKYPTGGDIDLKAGTPCAIQIGGDLVLTGYVDRYASSISAWSQHTIRVEGRSKSEDLVDCSALVPSTSRRQRKQRGDASRRRHDARYRAQARRAVSRRGQSTAGDGITVPQFNINLGETVWEIIDRITRYLRRCWFTICQTARSCSPPLAPKRWDRASRSAITSRHRSHVFDGPAVSGIRGPHDFDDGARRRCRCQHAGRRRDHP